MKCLYAILLLSLLTGSKALASADTTHLMHFDLNTGFPTNNVYSLVQDLNGYLWFASDNGVIKYNGYDFKIFNTSNGLPSNDAYQLYQDKKGRMWVNSMSYKFGYIKDDRFHVTNLKTKDRMFKAYYMADKGDYMFLNFWEYGYFSLAVIKDDLTAVYPLHYSISRDSTRNWMPIMGSFVTHDCKLSLFTGDDSLRTYDLFAPGTNKMPAGKPDLKYFTSFLGANSVVDLDNNFLFYFRNTADLFSVDARTYTHKSIHFSSTPSEIIYTVISASLDSRKVIYVITNSYLYVLDDNLGIVKKQAIAAVINTPSQLAYIFNDRFNNTWFTTNSDGVWCRYKSYGSLPGKKDLAVLAGARYTGSSSDGATYWWNKKNHNLYTLSAGGKLSKRSFPLSTGLRWVAEYGGAKVYLALTSGIYKYDRRTGSVYSIKSENKNTFIYHYGMRYKSEIKSDTAEKLFLGDHYCIQSFDSNRFFSVAVDGLHTYYRRNDTLTVKGVTDERYTNLYIDSPRHILYAYNSQKVLVYNIDSDRYLIFGAEYFERLGIKELVSIEVDKYYNVYLQGSDRMVIFNPLVNKVNFVNKAVNLVNSFFHLSNDKLLIAGKFGLAFAEVRGPLSISEFSVVPNVHYLYYNRINDFVANQASGILLSTDKGFYKTDLKSLTASKDLFHPSRINFFNLLLTFPVEQKINRDDTIFLTQKNEKINLGAINFYGKGNPVFRYQIDGYTRDWQQSDGEVFTGSMMPGRLYKINCYVIDEMWRSKVFTFFIYRYPYWWQTSKWALVFWILGITAVVILLLVVVLATRAVVARSNEKKRVLLELELRALYAQINPHFIFNTLSTAQFFISKKRFDDAYVHVNKFSRLLRAYLKSSQDRYITLDEEVNMLRNYIELQQIRFENKFSYRIEIDNKIPVMNLLIPSLLIQPLVENAITHGLFHKRDGGILIVKFLQGENDQQLVCIIEDNGVGRHKARELNRQDSLRKESYGTKLTQQLINIYREYEHVDIDLEYVDKSGAETGTIVKLVISKTKFVA